MRRVLVALDGSDFAWRALTAALDYARGTSGAMLHLLTVHAPAVTETISGDEPWRERERRRRLATLHTDWVLRQAEQRIPPDGPRYTKEALEGDPARVIAERAGALKCEVIFAGTHGMSGTQNEAMGSVATQLCAVSAVRVRLIR
jgi:nucleotide-binding universal stress UspA family protein